MKTDEPLKDDEGVAEQPLIQLPPVAVVEAQAEELPGETQLSQHLDYMSAAGGGAAEENTDQVPELVVAENYLASDPSTKTICETGFNAGHSALRFLEHGANGANTKVYSFDNGGHPYAGPNAMFLAKRFPGRILVLWGDSKRTVPAFFGTHPSVRCDLIYVDGGKDYQTVLSDLQNFQAIAKPTHNVVLVDDADCASANCQGPSRAWAEMVQAGQISQMDAETVNNGARGFAVGKYNFVPAPVPGGFLPVAPVMAPPR